MQYKVKTVDEYMARLDDDWRKEKLEAIRNFIFSQAPDIDEHINYGMLNYGNGDITQNVFALNAQKNYVSLYVGDITKIDPTGKLLEGFATGKGCIRIKKSTDIQSSNLSEFIASTLKKWKNGEDIHC